MLRALLDGSIFSNFTLIKDNENCSGLDIFNGFLESYAANNLIKKINLICYENPPDHYLPKNSSEKITSYNYFSDPLNWNDDSSSKTDLTAFLSDQPETAFFIDSISCLITYHKFYCAYKNLSQMKKSAMTIVALIHSDLLAPKEVEELERLSGAIVDLQECSYTKETTEKTVIVTQKKLNGKVIRQTEIATIDQDLKISSKRKVKETSFKGNDNVKETMQKLASFKLGLTMNENEKKARDELVLPYLRKQKDSGGGDIIYEEEDYELEEDPDDDLYI